jgi:hypothetical protein
VSMNLTALREMVRNLIFEDAADTGLVTDARLDALIQIAHREIYRKIATIAPTEFKTVTAATATSAQGALDFGASITVGILKWLALEIRNLAGDFERLTYIDRDEVRLFHGAAQTGTPTHWTRTGSVVQLLPESLAYVRLVHCPGPTDISDVVLPFGGALVEHHDLVGIRAADLAKTKDEKPSVWHPTYTDRMKDLQLELRKQAMQIKRTQPEDY